MTTFSSPDVLRFLGKKFTKAGEIPGRVIAEVTSDLKRRQEGVRIKHRYGENSVKLYDKAYTPVGSVLRAELTMQVRRISSRPSHRRKPKRTVNVAAHAPWHCRSASSCRSVARCQRSISECTREYG